ncbi:MAG: hypothetical protein CVU48_02200 [Candidatus Cloacimonetes bacterium HGW-Cloacimonetes-1]|jgi:cobalt-zinc-cadmium efflux system membrane fusion protein|nr:MAG: hypothetical protein CVU48_02200 [Candidatus Cloacimonetes bacterium HGW-Cloacimonetes-1]
MKKYILISMIIVLALTACGKKAAPKAAKPGGEDTQPVMIEALNSRSLDEYITVSGKLEGLTEVTMSSETSGRIMNLYKKLGDSVSKGERIGAVDNDIYRIRLDQAEAGLLSAQSAYDNATKNFSYAEQSRKRNLISEAEYNNALSGIKGAKAGLDGAKAGLEAAKKAMENSYLAAPESGMISNLLVSSGQYINPGQPIAMITDAKTLIMKSGVGESQITKLKRGQPAIVTYSGITEPFKGSLRGFGISPLPNSATYPLEIEIRNNGKLLPGMVVSAQILSKRHTDLLFTQITNIVKEFDKNYVYIINDKGTAERRLVVLGNIIGENVVLLSGVEIGENIVVSGTENLEDGTKVQIRQ